ncbi:hypothetical protein AMAG_15805 [Allomyces macrogynus ATCC 38327]|uniref:Branched-chain amino acid aminotransferase n=1 Tax=Allomyces macrogynus (strain ATCC 38327) TaxID=578462 RepID=A0A0L0T8K2_ALLM3|nr:hypothetical protein AMAG_15805 [Allomyces macrogynus ATCC 38327]|eukprot:KNE71138.1 hypothetical protein AMAG_15805 [Allomyces macrogynus ATCC 38327]
MHRATQPTNDTALATPTRTVALTTLSPTQPTPTNNQPPKCQIGGSAPHSAARSTMLLTRLAATSTSARALQGLSLRPKLSTVQFARTMANLTSPVIPVAARWTASPTASAAPVTAEITVETTNVPGDSNIWLLALPRGAYTGARTVQQSHIFDYQGHIQRTATSLAKMQPPSTPLERHLTDPPTLATWLRPVARAALSSYYLTNPTLPNHAETKITWLVASDGTLAVHCTHLKAPGPAPTSGQTKAILALGAGHRGNAAAKDSAWVSGRQALIDAYLTPDVNEVVLVDGSDVYEGLSSNFIAVVEKPDGEVVLQSAPLDAVLTGTILRAVIEDEKTKGVARVEFAFPQVAEVGTKWRAAAVTSTSRLVTPIRTVEIVDVGSGKVEKMVELDAQHPVLVKVMQNVQEQVVARAEKILD